MHRTTCVGNASRQLSMPLSMYLSLSPTFSLAVSAYVSCMSLFVSISDTLSLSLTPMHRTTCARTTSDLSLAVFPHVSLALPITLTLALSLSVSAAISVYVSPYVSLCRSFSLALSLCFVSQSMINFEYRDVLQ